MSLAENPLYRCTQYRFFLRQKHGASLFLDLSALFSISAIDELFRLTKYDIYGILERVKSFKDYTAKEIKMNDDAWGHIKKHHPETSEEMIKEALEDPDEIRESTKKDDTDIYYKKRVNNQGKERFTQVVVKKRNDGNWIDTAMTTAKMKEGKKVFKKNEKEAKE